MIVFQCMACIVIAAVVGSAVSTHLDRWLSNRAGRLRAREKKGGG